jgi:hypothetical protein
MPVHTIARFALRNFSFVIGKKPLQKCRQG